MNYGNIYTGFVSQHKMLLSALSVADTDIDTHNPSVNSQPLK